MGRDRHKILVLIKGLNLGGAERLLVDALPYLDRDRFDYAFAYLLPWSNFLVPEIEAAAFAVYCLDMASNARFLKALPALDRLQRTERFDLIHAHLPMAGLAARLVGRRHRVPVVYTEHNLVEHFRPAMLWATRLTYHWNERVFAVSDGVAESIARQGLDGRARVTTLLNGVPVERVQAEARDLDGLRSEWDIPAGHLVVGTVAVLTPQKRLTDWLAAARQIAARRDDVTFLLVGGGPEEAVLADRAQALGLGGRVRMAGFRPDARRAMGLMDVYLMTSEYEGLPVAMLEAMALGKPVVATAVGGIPEAVTHGHEGFLTPMGAVDDLAGYVLRLLDDPFLRRAMGRRAGDTVVQRFHCRDRIRTVEEAYMEILNAGTV